MADEIYLVVNSHADVLRAFSNPKEACSFLDVYEKEGKCNYEGEYVVLTITIDRKEETNG